MFKNRFLVALGILSLLLAAMAVSFPLSNTHTSVERSRAADTARWTAMGVYYEKADVSQLQRSRAVDTARWTAMGKYYKNVEGAQLKNSRAADAARWTAMADYYLKMSGK